MQDVENQTSSNLIRIRDSLQSSVAGHSEGGERDMTFEPNFESILPAPSNFVHLS